MYLPMKPIKWDIKIWERCGYTYDVSVYTGKEYDVADGSLGESSSTKINFNY